MGTEPAGDAPLSPAWPDALYGALRRRVDRFRQIDRSPVDRALRSRLPGLLRPGMLVLDVGCGTGVMACHLAASGAARVAYLGFDPDAEACAVARDVIAGLPQDAVRGEVQVAGIEDVARGRFAPADLVLVIRSLHECLEPSDPDSLAGVAVEISRLVSPGGRLLISEPVFADEASEEARDRIERYTRTIVGEPGKPHVPARAIRGAFEATGLRVESEHDGARFVLGRYLGLEQARQYTLLLGRG